MKTVNITISQPEAWRNAFRAAAMAKGQTLSQWMGDQCLAGLPKAQAKKLPKRPAAGRPKADD